MRVSGIIMLGAFIFVLCDKVFCMQLNCIKVEKKKTFNRVNNKELLSSLVVSACVGIPHACGL